jgi:hypothetical protein
MLELLQITNDPAFARRCDALGGIRLFVDLERNGKAERQAGRNTFISTHDMTDVGRVREAAPRSTLLVRLNPLHDRSGEEVEQALAQGADQLMLPMFIHAAELARFRELVKGRAKVVPLVETAAALESMEEWIGQPGLVEVFIGLNDLHLSLGLRFMFEPLALGMLDRVATLCKSVNVPFGFGGIARLDEGLLPGRDVLAEHLRLGSTSVILSRTFHRPDEADSFETEVAKLREAERLLQSRTPAQVEQDSQRIAATIRQIASAMGPSA